MPYITTQDKTTLFYNDWGAGQPIVLIHGWPLDADMWSDQAVFLAEQGYRVIAYDRRGFGRSSQPWHGYDYDGLAGDLAELMDQLALTNAVLVGFSMGGGEVARYLSRHGTTRIAKAVLISSVTPYLVKTEDNPAGVDPAMFEHILAELNQDRPHFLAGFAEIFYGNGLLQKNVSAEMLQTSVNTAMLGSLRATLECAKSFAMTDFRADMAAFRVPTLIIHGTADKTVPIDSSARVAAQMIPGAKCLEYEGAPHGLHVTANKRLNEDLLAFIG